MAKGCIPVIERGTVPLPFRHVLDWEHPYAPIVQLDDLWATAQKLAGVDSSGEDDISSNDTAWAEVARRIERKLAAIDKETYVRMFINVRVAWRLVINMVSRGHINHWRDEVHASYKYVVARNDKYMSAVEARYR